MTDQEIIDMAMTAHASAVNLGTAENLKRFQALTKNERDRKNLLAKIAGANINRERYAAESHLAEISETVLADHVLAYRNRFIDKPC